MTKKTTRYIKCMLLCLIIWSLSAEIFASETIKNMPSRNAYFTGRASYLDEMQKNLSQYGIVYLVGYGGVGKTQLAKEYGYINEQKYDLIWWFDLRGDLVAQYENLLTHLSNDEKFKKLLHVNIKDIAPSVVVDFTNSLLSQCNYRWLLIFDNVLSTKDIKLPKTKAAAKQHIIITTREKQNFGKNVLALEPFTDQESELFLFKIHPSEKKEDIVKLYKVLYNYPLALAQTSEEILMYKNGIGSYLEKYSNLGSKQIPIHSDITQEYNNNYRGVLDHTLQEIEQKDKESAKVLYMLALLKTDITKKLMNDLFGNQFDQNLIILSKYGVVQTTTYEQSQILNIHDIIREEAIKKFNNKSAAYKKEIILTLSKHLNNFYSEKNFQHLNDLDATNNQTAPLYAFIDVALQNDVINEEIINVVIISLKLNDILLNKRANYILYQQLANKIYSKNIDNITPTKKALLYANLVYSDFIFESEENLSKFEKEMLRLLNIVENDKNYEELFFIYTYISKLYLFLGDLNESKKYLEMAKKNINYADSTNSLLEYWWGYARLCYELRDINEATKALDIFEKISNQLSPGEINKFLTKNIRIKLGILNGQKDKARKDLEETIKNAAVYYDRMPSFIMGNLEFTKALIYFQDGQYNLAENQCNRALKIAKKVFDKDMISYLQANMRILLGEIYEKKGKDSLALEEYKKCLKFYSKRTYGRINNFYEYGELLSSLCVIYYKQKNYAKSKFYFQKLVANFGLEHELAEKLIKKLPVEYMYQVGGNNEK